MDNKDYEVPHIVKYKVRTDKDNKADSSIWRLNPYHTHFHFFDDGKDGTNSVQNILLKRQEIEYKLSISKALKSPVAGYQPKSTSMCCHQ